MKDELGSFWGVDCLMRGFWEEDNLSLLSENDEGLCVRIYNCSEYEDTAELQLCRPIAEAYVCNLYNEPQDRLNAVGNVLGVSLAAWQICTVQLRL